MRRRTARYLVEEATDRVTSEYDEKRSKMKVAQTQNADEARVQANKLKDLETHLDKAIARLNAAHERNDQLHEEIDAQRKERLGLDSVRGEGPRSDRTRAQDTEYGIDGRRQSTVLRGRGRDSHSIPLTYKRRRRTDTYCRRSKSGPRF